jgi:hypothetical protein
MPLQSIDDYLAQRSSGTSVIQALTTLREQAIAEKFEILGCRCTWNLWGGDRQSEVILWSFRRLPCSICSGGGSPIPTTSC